MTSQSQTIRFYDPPGLPRPSGYSHAAEVSDGKTIYVSGQVALDPSGALVGPGDLRAQTEQVFANVQQPPASSAVEVRRLFRDDVLIEIEAIAVVPA